MFCWRCGKEIYPGAFFCTNCGTKAVQPQEAGQQPSVGMMPPGFAERPVETQEPVAPPESEFAVQVPPAVIVPPAPVMQSGEAQEPMLAGSGMQESMSPKPVTPGMQGSMSPKPAEPGIQRYVSAMPVEQKPMPKPLKKGVVVTVIIVAVLVFLVGVGGAFYFAGTGGDSDRGMTQGRREELEDDAVSHGEDIGEYSQSKESDNKDAEKEEETGNNSEIQRDDSDAANSANSGEDSIEGNQSDSWENPMEGNQSSPWENPMEGKRIPAFSGRDIYPGIDGYAEGQPGDSMHTYWFDYTVTGAYICTEYGGYLPKAGYEVLVVEMAVKNTFDEWIPMFDDDFQAQWNDISDNAYAWPIEDAELLGEDVLPAYYVLEEGQMAVGLLLFEVPVGYTNFSLAYWEIFEDNTYGDLFFLDFTVDRNQIEIIICERTVA